MTMIEVKTSELSGAALDWVLSRMIGANAHACDKIPAKVIADFYFPTKLSRDFAASRLGDTVSVPAELVQS